MCRDGGDEGHAPSVESTHLTSKYKNRKRKLKAIIVFSFILVLGGQQIRIEREKSSFSEFIIYTFATRTLPTFLFFQSAHLAQIGTCGLRTPKLPLLMKKLRLLKSEKIEVDSLDRCLNELQQPKRSIPE